MPSYPTAVIEKKNGIIARVITPWFPAGTSAESAIEQRDLTVPEGYLLDVARELEDEDGYRVKFEFKTILSPDAKSKLAPMIINTLQQSERALTTPLWDTIDRAKPTKITYRKPTTKPRIGNCEYKRAFFLGDPQIGFMIIDGEFIPFHDPAAIDVAIQLIADSQPEKIEILGDFLDLASQSRWVQEASFAGTTQRAIDYGHEMLARIRAAAPDAEIILIEGNHDARLVNFIVTNSLAAYGLRRANTKELPVMTLPYLLRLDELAIKYIDAYPAGADWVTPWMKAIHGTKASSKASTSSQYLTDNPTISTAHGHSHRREVQERVTIDALGRVRTVAFSPGALCRVDGTVPSVNGGTKLDGTRETYWENWQQGVAILDYSETDRNDFWLNVIAIDNGKALYKDKFYYAREGLALAA
jgi:hypothetical protein